MAKTKGVKTYEELEELRETIAESPLPYYKTDEAGNIIEFNQAFARLLGFDESEEDALKLINAEDLFITPKDRKKLAKEFNEKQSVEGFEVQLRKKDGSPIYALIHAKQKETDEKIFYIGHMTDITGLKELTEELRKQTIIDPLTSLYFNKTYISDIIRRQKELSRRHNHPLSAVFIDADNFKFYNKSYGHRQGDQALITFSGIMRDLARSGDIYARMGGEEFLLVLPETDLENSVIVAERVRTAVEETKIPLVREFKNKEVKYPLGNPEKMTISLGVSSYPETSPLEFLIDNADTAMGQAKDNGKNRIVVYQSTLE